MKNNKGFTLVELLATISILGIIMLIAVPNIIGTVERNKKTTYIEDAKKMVSLAENKMRSNSRLIKPTAPGNCGITYKLSELDNGDLSETAPEGGKYDQNLSFVAITYSSGSYIYKVQIVENVPKTKKTQRGIKFIESTKLKNDEIELSNTTTGWTSSTNAHPGHSECTEE